MAGVDEAREAGGLAEAARRREEPDRLVAPRRVERMLVDRQELDVREAHADHVGHQRVGELVVGEPAAVVVAPPGARGAPRRWTSARAAAPPCAARAIHSPSDHAKPAVAQTIDAVDGRSSAPKPDRVGLERQQRALRADDLVLVDRAVAERRDEDLPDAGVHALAHRVAAAVPAVEVADDRDAPRVRRPHREVHARGAFVRRSDARPAGRRASRACPRRGASRRAGRAPARRRTGRRPSTCRRALAARSR